jgi:protein gp37
LFQKSRIDKGLYWDRLWRLVDGCTPISPGCEHCWSARYTHRFDAEFKGSCDHSFTSDEPKFTGNIKLRHDNLDLPLHTQKPKAWLILNDLFHEELPFDFIQTAFSRMTCRRHHIFLVLTKRPQKMIDFWKWNDGEDRKYRIQPGLSNIWLGCTVCNQQEADEKIPLLLQIPAAVRFISYEPALGPILIKWWLNGNHESGNKPSWLICGGESGPGARPMNSDWALSIKNQCVSAGIPLFFKQWGSAWGKYVGRLLDGKLYSELPGKI